MGLRTCLSFPGLAHQLRGSTQRGLRSHLHTVARSRSPPSSPSKLHYLLSGSKSPLRAQTQTGKFSSTSYTREYAGSGRRFYAYAGVAGVGLGVALSTLPSTNGVVHCEAPPPAPATNTPQSLPPPPESSVNFYELSFGTVAGLCAGVFVKKGAKIVGFFLGGIFVLLQYFAHASFIRVDWTRFSTRFEDLFYTTSTDVKTGETVRKAPSVASLVRWIVDFLTADFQQRASFVAGFALGLRIA